MKMLRFSMWVLWATMIILVLNGPVLSVHAYAEDNQPNYSYDRGTGIPAAIFGTYIKANEVVFYPFYEYYQNNSYSYNPKKFGYNQDAEYNGKFKASQELIYLGYGINDRFLVEVEGSYIKGDLSKAANDNSNMPSKISESGFADIQAELRWRWSKEGATLPEFYSYLEYAFPIAKSQPLIGTYGEYIVGVGAVKGFDFGTLTLRADVAYDREERKMKFGEYALEYLKKLSDKYRIAIMLEGESDTLSLVAELQWRISKNAVLKINSGFGLTAAADDITPEIGVMFYF